MQAKGQNNSFGRQPLAIGMDRDNIKDVGKETWDRKMKRKHSTGTVLAGSAHGEGEPRRVKYLKQASESGLQSCDAIGLPFEGCSPSSDTIMTSTTTSGLASKGAISNIQFTKNKKDDHSFPTRISESVEFGAGKNGQIKLKEKELDRNKGDGRAINDSRNIGSLRIKWTKKEINPNKEETGDGLRRQCSGKNGISSTEQKSEILTLSKRTRNTKPSSLKNASGSRRPRMKKSQNSNKAIAHLGHPSTSTFLDIAGERGRNILNQSDSKELSSMVDMVDQPHDGSFRSSQMDLEYKLPPLYQRVLTALIIDDQNEETVGDENISFLHERDDPSVGFYTETVSCNGNATVTCDKMSMDDKLLMELWSVGIYPEPVPKLADGGCEAIDQETRKSCFLDPMFKDVLFVTPALDNHTVSTVDDIRTLAQNSQQDFAPPDSFPSRGEQNVLGNSNHPSNLDFSRTRPILNGGKKGKVLPDDVGASAYMGGKKGEMLLDDVGASDSLGGKKGKVLLDDVGASASLGGKRGEVLLDIVGVDGSASLEGKKGEVLPEDVGASATLGNSFLGGTKRKRSKRGTNKDTSKRNYVKRGGRSSTSNTRSERKTKAKAKPKTDELSTSAKGSLGKLGENTNSKHNLACGSDQLVSSGNKNVGSVSHDYSTNDFAIETEDPLDLTNMPELDSIEVGADKDLDSWLDIDVDALEDDDDAVGLDIPMDDLFTVL